MSRPSFCTECGTRLSETDRFCTQCGKAVPVSVQEARPPAPPPAAPPSQAPVPPIPPPIRAAIRPVPAKSPTGGTFKDKLSSHKGLCGCLAAGIVLGVVGLVIVVILLVNEPPDGSTGESEQAGQTELAVGEGPAEAVLERLGPEKPVDPLLESDAPVGEEEAVRRLGVLSKLAAEGSLGEVPALPETPGDASPAATPAARPMDQ